MRFRYALSVLVVLASASGVSGCEEAEPFQETRAMTTQDAGTTLPPDPVINRPVVDTKMLFSEPDIFTGFDGTHTFAFPIAVYGGDADLKVTASDAAALDIRAAKLKEPDANDKGKHFLVTAKKAGSFELNAVSGTKTAKSTVTVTAYTADRWTTGERRYKNGGGTGANQVACTQCHQGGEESPDHSPTALKGVDDARVQQTINEGILADGTVIADFFPYEHKWQTTEAELKGLVTYLRALPQNKVVLE